MSDSDQPTPEEIAYAANVLDRLPRDFLPPKIFIAISKKVTVPVMEVVPLRQREDGEVEILLLQRPDDDPYWPKWWHVPGTVIRATDKAGTDFSSGFERVLQGELHGTVPMIGKPQYVTMKFWDSRRSRELDQVFYFETNVKDEEIQEGKFFSVSRLPDPILEHHLIMIPEIVAAFLKNKGET